VKQILFVVLIFILVFTAVSSSSAIDLCVEFLKHGKYDKAIEACSSQIDSTISKAIDLKSKHFVAYSSRGLAYHFKGNYDMAIADFDKAIDLKPDDVDMSAVYANRGHSLKAKGEADQALADYHKALASDPRKKLAHYNLACIYSVRRQIKEACASLQKATENGYSNWEKIKSDPELNNIRDAPCFEKILNKR